MDLTKIKIFTIIFISLFIGNTLNGCIGPQEAMNQVQELIKGEENYEWKNRLEIRKEEFNILNFLSAPNEWPFFITQDTLYMWIYIEIIFSNIFNKDWDLLNQGRINITLVNPLGDSVSYSYSTALGKPNEDKDIIFLHNPLQGQWHIEVKSFGTGSYGIIIDGYQL
jgi:hypothetical protein